MHSDDREESERELTAERRGVQASIAMERRFVHKDGDVVWGHVTASTVIGSRPRPVLTFAIVQDVSERVRAEHEKRRERQFVDRLVEAAQAIIMVTDPKGRVVQFNPYMEELCGYELDEVRGLDWFKTFTAPEERQSLRNLYLEADELQLRGAVTAILTRDGERRHIQWSADTLREPDGRVTGVLSVGLDITEQMRAAQEVLVEKERSRAILETALDGILTMDERGVIESFNPSAERMFGYSQADLVGCNVNILMPPPYRSDQVRYLSELLRTGTGAALAAGREFKGCHRDGTVFPIHVSLAEMQVGSRRSFCAFVRNLTESKKVEEQLRQSQKMEAVGRLASGVAHDFNNLLMGVSGCAKVAMECVHSNRSPRMYLAEIKKAADSGTAMTKQLLAFGRKAKVEPVVFDFDDNIRSQESLLMRLLGEDIEFELDLRAPDCLVRADIGQIDQVLMNLAVNARDAMPLGGRLSIATMAATRGLEDIGDADDSKQSFVVLRVIDNGCGMSAETRRRLFEPFYTTKEVGKGTGLGLATVYGIVKQAVGEIEVHSAPGVGTCFEIRLPLSKDKKVQQERRPPRAQSEGLCEGTILLCEDDRLVSMAIQFSLEGAGYRVLKAASGSEAIECCRRYPASIDLLLTDVVLPDHGGERIAAEARALKPGIQALFMSAHTEEWLRSEGRIHSTSETLQKPFDEELLLLRISQLLDPGRPEPGAEPAPAAKAMSRPEHRGSVLVVEDSSAARLAIADYLRDEGWEVVTAGNGGEAHGVLREGDRSFDALLIDYSLPDAKGDAIASAFIKAMPRAAVAYMSGYPGLKLNPPGLLLEKPLDLETLGVTLASIVEASAPS
jgi:PAS domain S-box-containing protein